MLAMEVNFLRFATLGITLLGASGYARNARLDIIHPVLLPSAPVVRQEAVAIQPTAVLFPAHKALSAQVAQQTVPCALLDRFRWKIRLSVLRALPDCIAYPSSCHNCAQLVHMPQAVQAFAVLACQAHFHQKAHFHAFCVVQGLFVLLCVMNKHHLLKFVPLAFFQLLVLANVHGVQMAHIRCRIQVPALHVPRDIIV